MTKLQAVPPAEDRQPVDLTEFVSRCGPDPRRRWNQALAALSPDDRAKLRSALLESGIADYAISLWFERRDVVVDPRTIRGWRRRGYASR